MSLGIDIVKAPGATGDYRTNLGAKARALVDTITNEQQKYANTRQNQNMKTG